MPKYKIRFLVETPIAAAQDLAFSYTGHKITFLFTDRTIPSAVEVELCCDGEDWKQAVILATDKIIPPVLDVIAFQRKAPLLLNSPTRVLKAEPGANRRSVLLMGEDPFPTRCYITPTMAADIDRVLGNNFDDFRPALRWIRNSYRLMPIRDWFAYAWLALESLAGPEMAPKKCSKCFANLQCAHCGEDSYPRSNRNRAYDIANGFGGGGITR